MPQAAPPLVRGPAVPLRAAPGGPLPRVPPDRRRAARASPGPAGDAEVLGMLFAFLARARLHGSRSRRSTASRAGAAREAFSRALRDHVRPHAAAPRRRRPQAARGEPAAALRLEGPGGAARSWRARRGRSTSWTRRPAPTTRSCKSCSSQGGRPLPRERRDRAGPRLLHADGLRGRVRAARRAERDPRRRPLRQPRRRPRRPAARRPSASRSARTASSRR